MMGPGLFFHRYALLAACLVLAACSLPRGAALQSEVLATADDETAAFAVYPVTRDLLPAIGQWPLTGEQHFSWISRGQRGGRHPIAAGDQLDLQIWDSGENSLLTGAGQKVVGLQKLVVDPDGRIFVPYLDRVEVAGSSTEQARMRIQDQLAVLIPSAQVQLGLTAGPNSSVSLVGGVGQPGSFPLPDQGLTVLNLLSLGGGVSEALKNPQIRLMRGGEIYGTSVARLFAEPGLDTSLRGGDKVIVQEDKRYFLSLGAAGSEAIHPFPKDVVTGLDALSIIGGISDARADPKGLLILREYPSSAVAASTGQGPGKAQVVFTLDLTTADGLFSARKFRVNPGDLILATESPVTKTQTILGLIGSSFGVANAASGI
jgi:polysaccharide export outer membrane protein